MVQLHNFFFKEIDTLNKVIMGLILSYLSHLIHKSICIMNLPVKKENWRCNAQNYIENPS